MGNKPHLLLLNRVDQVKPTSVQDAIASALVFAVAARNTSEVSKFCATCLALLVSSLLILIFCFNSCVMLFGTV